ncbi:MAG: hypothetical protein Kapaf2KO_08630 [Candidatus Kapaibacteriales bacterium]
MKKLLNILSYLLLCIFAISDAVYANETHNGTEVILNNGEIDIAGDLLEAEEGKTKPLYVLISGSGAQDRDETIFGFKPFENIATELGVAGFSSYRFDDRQVGESTGKFAEATLDILSSDVVAIMDYFSNQANSKYDSFVLLGHSQGGVVAGKVARADSRVKGVVLMASPTQLLKDVISEQVRSAQVLAGATEKQIKLTLDFQEAAYCVVAGKVSDSVAKEKFRIIVENQINGLPPAQKAMVGNIDALVDQQYNATMNSGMKSPQMASLLFYDPIDDIRELKIPVLALFGAKDTQVPPEENSIMIKDLKKRNDRIEIYTLPKANHLFQEAGTGQASEYSTLKKEFIPDFMDTIKDWSNRNFTK